MSSPIPLSESPVESPAVIAARLEVYIRLYTPPGWVERLGRVIAVPSILEETATELLSSYEHGTLSATLVEHPLRTFQNPGVQRAVQSFFDSELYRRPRPLE